MQWNNEKQIDNHGSRKQNNDEDAEDGVLEYANDVPLEKKD